MSDELFDVASRVRELIPNAKHMKMKVLQNISPSVYAEVLSATHYMEPTRTLTDRMVFIESNVSSSLICRTCGNPHSAIVGERPNRRVSDHCSVDCRYADKQYTKGRLKSVDQPARVARMVATNLKKYGVEYQSQRSENKPILKKSKISCPVSIAKLMDRDWLVKAYTVENLTLTEIGDIVGVHYSTVTDYLRSYGVEIRTIINRSSQERVISSILDEIGIEYVENTKDILPQPNMELDFHIPSKNVAIEVDGLFWHSFPDYTRVDKHLMKTQSCLDMGIKLMHFTDNQVTTKLDIVKSMIQNSIGVHDHVIRASKCDISIVTNAVATEFQNHNHISGSAAASACVGLFYKSEMVALMTFGKSRFDRSVDWEVIRLCTKLNTVVHGGASKLFNFAVSEFDMKSVMSYADRMIGEGGVYHKLGFKYVKSTKPGYFWTDGKSMLSRYQTMKKNLPARFPDYTGQSEREFMVSKGWKMFHDCGNNVYRWFK